MEAKKETSSSIIDQLKELATLLDEKNISTKCKEGLIKPLNNFIKMSETNETKEPSKKNYSFSHNGGGIMQNRS